MHMTKDTIIDDDKIDLDPDNLLDKPETEEKVNDKETPIDDSESDKPLTVRQAIDKAFKESKEADEDKEPATLKAPIKAKKEPKVAVEDEDEDEDSDNSKETDSGLKDNTSNKIKSELKDDLKAPVSWDKVAKDEWNKLPNHVRQAINKRETEVSNGFAQYSEKTKQYEALERVIAPRRQQIQQFGASEAETVHRLFQWMEALSGANKVQAYQQLGKSFGINTQSETSQGANNESTDTNADDDASYVPPKLRELLETVVSKVSTFEQSQQQNEAAAARNYVETWAADKPHYQKVSRVMYGLITSGSVPLDNGRTTNKVLDTAYNMAIYADQDIRAELDQKRQADESAKQAKATAEADKKRKEQLAKAKKAASSIRPQAPATQASTPSGRKTNGQSQSVSDSIRAAMAEVNQ